MRLWGAAVLVLVACGGSDKPAHFSVAPKPPNDQLIVGDYERKPPAGTTAIRFDRDGNVKVAHDKGKLDGSEPIALGTYKLDGDQLTLTYTEGACKDDGPGIYKVVISKLGIRFSKVDDSCEQRSRIDNEVWRRVEVPKASP